MFESCSSTVPEYDYFNVNETKLEDDTMNNLSQTKIGKVLLSTAIAAGLALASVPAAFAGEGHHTLQRFLAHPANYVAVKDGMSGPVEYASLVNDRLAVQFHVPTHAGDMLGAYVGSRDTNGQFVGRGVLTTFEGETRSVPMTISFQDDGTILADIEGEMLASGFIPHDMYSGY